MLAQRALVSEPKLHESPDRALVRSTRNRRAAMASKLSEDVPRDIPRFPHSQKVMSFKSAGEMHVSPIVVIEDASACVAASLTHHDDAAEGLANLNSEHLLYDHPGGKVVSFDHCGVWHSR